MLNYKQIWHGIKPIRWLNKFNLTAFVLKPIFPFPCVYVCFLKIKTDSLLGFLWILFMSPIALFISPYCWKKSTYFVCISYCVHGSSLQFQCDNVFGEYCVNVFGYYSWMTTNLNTINGFHSYAIIVIITIHISVFLVKL